MDFLPISKTEKNIHSAMATRTQYEESMVERDEILYPTTDLLDTEPLYSNFATIQNDLRQREEQKHIHQVSDLDVFVLRKHHASSRRPSIAVIPVMVNIGRFILRFDLWYHPHPHHRLVTFIPMKH
jgi:hypothetical protein